MKAEPINLVTAATGKGFADRCTHTQCNRLFNSFIIQMQPPNWVPWLQVTLRGATNCLEITVLENFYHLKCYPKPSVVWRDLRWVDLCPGTWLETQRLRQSERAWLSDLCWVGRSRPSKQASSAKMLCSMVVRDRRHYARLAHRSVLGALLGPMCHQRS